MNRRSFLKLFGLGGAAATFGGFDLVEAKAVDNIEKPVVEPAKILQEDIMQGMFTTTLPFNYITTSFNGVEYKVATFGDGQPLWFEKPPSPEKIPVHKGNIPYW